jgi:hypothetical protein
MPQTSTVNAVPGVFPVVIVIAVSAVAALAIGAWLVSQVARRAIDKVPPEGVAPVILALDTMLNSLRLYLPWSNRSGMSQPPSQTGNLAPPALHNETSHDLSLEVNREAQP